MFWKRRETPKCLPKIALCYADSAMTCEAADALAQLGLCEPAAILADTSRNILWLCRREKPEVLVLETLPDAMEKLDDPTKDITGRCELSAQVKEVLPACRVYLMCAGAFRDRETVLQKAVETQLIDGYCFGSLTKQQVEAWLLERNDAPAAGWKNNKGEMRT